MKKKRISTLGFILVMFSFFLAGCVGSSSEEGLGRLNAQEEALSDSGTLILKVNPEIALTYNEEGVVTDITGNNEDGQKIIDNYADFIGKDSGLVLEELIALINEEGYFVEEVEGEPKRVVLELEAGSILPDEQFLEKMTTNVQNAVTNLDVETDVVNAEGISLEEAKQIAFDHAGVKAEDAHFDDQELDKEDGRKLYELEFYANGYEYEYDIDAETGEILKSERDRESNKKDSGSTQAQKSQQKNTPKQQANKNEYISMDRAKQIAFEHAGVNGADAHFDDQEFDVDDGVPSYELEFYVNGNEYEYDIHAVSGEILKSEHDMKHSKSNQKPAANKSAQISKEEAIDIALNHAGLTRAQVTFDDVELDEEDGRLIWEIEFDSGNWEFEYDIDALTKDILDFEKDYDD
jgi:uncharacterized membrane protein YkoI